MGHVRSLRVLCEVDTRGSFTSAAEALGLSQSAVSQHVAALERQAGTALVEHGVRPLALTVAGQTLVGHGRAIMARVETAEQELAEILGRRQGRLRIGTFPTALTTFAPAAISRFRTRYPDVTLTVVDDHLQRLVPRLRDRELDLALAYDHEALGPLPLTDVVRVPLFDDPFRVLLPRGHRLLRRRGPLDLTDLAPDRWIGGCVESAWFGIVRHACRSAGFEPQVTIGSDDYHAVQAFVAAGLGVAVVPGLATARVPDGVTVKVLRGPPSRRIFVVLPQEAFPLATAESMVADLKVAARRYLARGGSS